MPNATIFRVTTLLIVFIFFQSVTMLAQDEILIKGTLKTPN